LTTVALPRATTEVAEASSAAAPARIVLVCIFGRYIAVVKIVKAFRACCW